MHELVGLIHETFNISAASDHKIEFKRPTTRQGQHGRCPKWPRRLGRYCPAALGSRSIRAKFASVLCAEVQTLLATFNETCNKFAGREPAAKSLAAAMEELDALRRAMLAV